MNSKTFIAASALIGTIIGAGFLGIPYVAMQSGFLIALIIMTVTCVLLITTMLYLGEVSLRTKTRHQLTGYAEKYLGKKGKLIMFIAVAVGLYSALVGYLIAESQSLSALFFFDANYSIYLGLAFWFLMSILCWKGLKVLEEGASIGIILVILLVAASSILFWSKINPSNLTYTNLQNWYAPFGIILFSFLGFSAIPTINQILRKDEKLMKRTIIISYLAPLLIYSTFTAVVLGYKGASTPQIATLVLGKPFILIGIITMFTSYVALSVALIETFRFDYKKSKFVSWILATIIPLVLFLILQLTKNADFIKILGIGGVISGGLTAILALQMVKNAKKSGKRKPEYSIPYSPILSWVLILIYVIGAIFEIIHTIIS